MKNANVEDLYRLTPIQEGMLFHTLYGGEVAPYFEQFVITYGRELDLDRIESAWRQAIERHPVLRTSFFWEEVEASVQIVHRRADLLFERQDWRHLSPPERDEELRRFLAEDRARGFALDRAPLLRLAVIRWDDASWRIVWSYHHLLLDGWSAGLLLRDVKALYEAAGGGAAAALEPRRPFRDYISWLRQQDLAAAEAYWRRTFEGFTAPTPLGIDRTPGRPVGPGDVHATIEAVLPAALTAAVEDFARRQRLTLHTLIEGAWALALARYSGGAEEVVFGSTLSGRPTDLAGADAMIGCFINTLPVRVKNSPAQELLPWLRGLQASQMELRRFEHSPLVEVRRWSGLPGDRPLFEAILVFESFSGPGSRSSQAGDRNGWQAHQRTNFPLTLVVWPGHKITLTARFYTGRFAAVDVSRLLGYVTELLQAFVAAPDDRRLGDLPALPQADLRQLEEWNRIQAVGESETCLHELFEEQVERSPGAVALVCGEERLTYRELNGAANRLAHHLVCLGVGPEVPVALCLERTPSLLIALLAVLKAGGAYVPVDPSYPAERRRLILEDCQDPLLITERPPADPPPPGTRLLCLDEEADKVARQGSGNPRSRAGRESLAYVIYTSGSTGRPKGVPVAHGNVIRLFRATRPWFGFGDRDVWTLFHSSAFDFSVWEIWGALLHGGRLVVVPYWMSRTPSAFHDLLRREGVTVLNQTPSAFRQLAAADEESAPLAALRLVIFGGEALDPQGLRPWFDRYGDRSPRLVNMYGITETTVHVTCRPLSIADLAAGGSPIGRAIPDLGLQVLDRSLQPVPIGVPGELCVGGAGLARGYLGRPDLTAERFEPDPFAAAPGARLYRSGDLVRYRSDGGPDGDLDHLGRIDHQVKIRGVRIELGEIEAALRSHESVSQAVVAMQAERTGDAHLAAWLVPRNGSSKAPELLISQVRESLARQLPPPMIPSSWMVLPELPLTPNGKVDRKVLPRAERSAGVRREAPQSAIERTIAQIWRELLNIEEIGVHDNFFDLGGHSLLMPRMQGLLRERLDREVGLVELFGLSTIRVLADHLARGEDEEAALPGMERQESRAEQGRSRLRKLRTERRT